MYLSAKFGDYRPYRKKVINSYVNSYMKTELTASIRHIAIFFTDADTQILMAETREEEEGEHRQLQSVVCFTQTQKILLQDNVHSEF